MLPGTSMAEAGGSELTLSDLGHDLLDVAGFVPGYGEAADVANAVWYASQGSFLDAGLSLISIIPIVGDFIGKSGRIANHLGPKATRVVVEALQEFDAPRFLDRFRSDPALAPHIDSRKHSEIGKRIWLATSMQAKQLKELQTAPIS